jgi:uncharacterized protein YggE
MSKDDFKKIGFFWAIPILGLALIMIFTSIFGSFGSGKNNGGRFIEVQAVGASKVVPDAVDLAITVSSTQSNSQQALTQTAASVSKVLATLKTAGIDEKNIKTTSLNSSPVYSYVNNTQKITGYQASQNFDITIRIASSAGKVIDDITKAAGNNLQVNAVNSFVFDPTAAQVSAQKSAAQSAKVKAEAYARALGVKLGKVISLTETPAASLPVPVMAMSKSASDSTQISLGTQDVTVTLDTRWDISAR